MWGVASSRGCVRPRGGSPGTRSYAPRCPGPATRARDGGVSPDWEPGALLPLCLRLQHGSSVRGWGLTSWGRGQQRGATAEGVRVAYALRMNHGQMVRNACAQGPSRGPRGWGRPFSNSIAAPWNDHRPPCRGRTENSMKVKRMNSGSGIRSAACAARPRSRESAHPPGAPRGCAPSTTAAADWSRRTRCPARGGTDTSPWIEVRPPDRHYRVGEAARTRIGAPRFPLTPEALKDYVFPAAPRSRRWAGWQGLGEETPTMTG